MPDLDKIESLFHQALALPPAVDRTAWLDAECAGDPRLIREISTLLEARSQMVGAAHRSEAGPPQAQFGPYRALHLLGRGGMSAVYLAERADGQFQQTVALKVMAGYLADREFFRRFEAERQFLAVLNHHNIPRLLDGGVSSAGDPFLVTEYVDGQSIDRHCEEKKLDIQDRLRIFLQVCEAVDYAHRNLIVHRDLKPANILVNREGVAKLLDFGTAALTKGAQNNPTLTRLRMLTPRYASPEQIRGERVNTATDVFSLGVVLYELLTGAWPFGDPNSMLGTIDRTSGHMTANPPQGAVTEEAARSRSASRAQLIQTLRGDLSAIVLKALEVDPARRYESVRAMAVDLENFLVGRPVSARLQTAAYRAGKFLRRRWLGVSAAAVFVLTLAAAAIVAVHQAQVAKAEALKAEKVNEFMNGMLSSTAKTFTVVQMLEAAEERLDKSWTRDLRTEATLRRSLGASYLPVMKWDRARIQFEKSIAEFQSLGDDRELAETLLALASLAAFEGHPAEAVAEDEQVLEKLKRLGKDAPPALVFAAKDHLANTLILQMSSRMPEARKLLEEAISLGNRDSSIPRADLARSMGHYASTLSYDGKRDEAVAMLRKALDMARKEDPEGMAQVDLLYGLAAQLAPQDPSGARELVRQRYELLASRLGPDNAQTAVAKIQWARARARSGQVDEAAAQVLEAMEIVRRQFPPPSLDRWVALSASAHILNQAKRFKEAESLAREMQPIVDANHLRDDDPRRAESLLELGNALRGQDRNPEADGVLLKSAAIYEAAGPNWFPRAKLIRESVKKH